MLHPPVTLTNIVAVALHGGLEESITTYSNDPIPLKFSSAWNWNIPLGMIVIIPCETTPLEEKERGGIPPNTKGVNVPAVVAGKANP